MQVDCLGSFARLSAEELAERAYTSLRTARRWRASGLAPRIVVRWLEISHMHELGLLSPHWQQWRIENDLLVSPNGFRYRPSDIEYTDSARLLIADHIREVMCLTDELKQLRAAKRDDAPPPRATWTRSRDYHFIKGRSVHTREGLATAFRIYDVATRELVALLDPASADSVS